ncbi:hypothetical protein CFD26_107904 [Aspergillus turcosus]|uniref:Uncharacterized protein n=1 Tax=Aspergillus turcosus TaxID=1245748 RepID=A0A421DBU5_9EURO|nr:hypothetical protein CFD26_107904 [Aspergillus turcosus]
MAARQDSPILLHPGTTSPVVYLLNDWSFSLGVEILVPKGCEEVFQSSVLNWYNRGQLYNKSSSRKLVVRITAQDRMLRSAENFLEGFTSTTPSLVLPAPTNKRFSICKIVPFTARTNIGNIKAPHKVRARWPVVAAGAPGSPYAHFPQNQRTLPLHASFDECEYRHERLVRALHFHGRSETEPTKG